jgi:3-oxoacyl-[acyl-carrier-protein] synthase-3
MSRAVGMRSLAIAHPRDVRTNDFYRRAYPETVERITRHAQEQLWKRSAQPRNLLEEAMQPYLDDPFRGAVERRVLGRDEPALSMELSAARRALAAARLGIEAIDLIIVASFPGDHIAIGNATFLAGELGARCGAWNLETACSGSVVGFQTACNLVRGGDYRHVLFVASCGYTKRAPEADPISWFLGDGAGAFVVAAVDEGLGYLGGHAIHSADTCGTWSYELERDQHGDPAIVMRASPQTGAVMAATATPHLRAVCSSAVAAAGVTLADISLFVFHTAVPWFAPFAARALEVDVQKTICTNRLYGNISAALMPANLFHAARAGRIRRGQLVLLQSLGAASSAAAVVMRWNEPALGALDSAHVTD